MPLIHHSSSHLLELDLWREEGARTNASALAALAPEREGNRIFPRKLQRLGAEALSCVLAQRLHELR